MKTTFLTFTSSLIAYALITLPAIVIPPMYGLSLLYASCFGVAAWILYHSLFTLIKPLLIIEERKWLLLILSIPACVAVAYTLIELFNVEENVWTSCFIFFPIIAVVSGWIGLYKTRHQISEIFTDTNQNQTIRYE